MGGGLSLLNLQIQWSYYLTICQDLLSVFFGSVYHKIFVHHSFFKLLLFAQDGKGAPIFSQNSYFRRAVKLISPHKDKFNTHSMWNDPSGICMNRSRLLFSGSGPSNLTVGSNTGSGMPLGGFWNGEILNWRNALVLHCSPLHQEWQQLISGTISIYFWSWNGFSGHWAERNLFCISDSPPKINCTTGYTKSRNVSSNARNI